MNYTEFVNAVKEKLTQELNGGVRVNIYTTKKNNATERTGLILETPGVNISPTIYLEEFFELYEKGKQMDWIIEDLVELYEEIRQEKSWDYERMLSFEGVKDRIIFRLINTEKNKELLLDVPHREFLDLSLVFAVLVEADNDGTAVMLIKDLHMRQWKVTKEQLWNVAKENTKRLLPAECFGMNFAVYELLSRSTPGEHDRENLLRRTWHIHEELELPEKDKMYVLSNKLKNYGAACIAYPYILDMLAGVLKENFYVLPSSVHEVIIVPESSQIRQSELERMVREINETQVPEEEILSNHAYFYYAHLDSYAELEKGDPVKAGDLLGYMGDSGYGEEGTTGEFPVHLHLGIYLKEGTEEISVNPYPVLRYAENARIKCVYSR